MFATHIAGGVILIDTMVWHEGVSRSWICNPTEELRYIVVDVTEAHYKYNAFTASVGVIVTDENNIAVSKHRMWLDLEFIIDSDSPPQRTTSTLDSVFRACAADFASRVIKHTVE